MEIINIEKLKQEKIDLFDFTKYELIGLEEYDIEFSNDSVAKWIHSDDENACEDDFDTDYNSDDRNHLMIMGYCGKTELTIISRKDKLSRKISVTIKSRFKKIDYENMGKIVLDNQLAKGDYERLCKDDKHKKNGSGDQTEGLYYMPALYEAFVRHCIRSNIDKPQWKLIEGEENNSNKKVCPEEIINTTPEEKRCFKADVYLEGDVIPDVVLYDEENNKYVILDVKYKKGEYNASTRSDRLQILAYAYMWKCEKVGHVFPEKESKDSLPIGCNKNVSIQYCEFKINTNDCGVQKIIDYLN